MLKLWAYTYNHACMGGGGDESLKFYLRLNEQ